MWIMYEFFFQAEDGIRDLVRSRGLGDVYKRQVLVNPGWLAVHGKEAQEGGEGNLVAVDAEEKVKTCLLYTSDAADERSSVDLGGRRIIKKKKKVRSRGDRGVITKQDMVAPM